MVSVLRVFSWGLKESNPDGLPSFQQAQFFPELSLDNKAEKTKPRKPIKEHSATTAELTQLAKLHNKTKLIDPP